MISSFFAIGGIFGALYVLTAQGLDFSSALLVLIVGLVLLLSLGWRYRASVLAKQLIGILPVLIVIFLTRVCVMEPFHIPSASMEPTLYAGDFILVDKSCYGIHMPFIQAPLMVSSLPQRGDIIVFRYPQDTTLHYIKRVVGLPGDRIVYRHKTLYINDVAQVQRFMAEEEVLERRIEQLDGGTHEIFLTPGIGLTASHEIVVPVGQYFVLGDNRDKSEDSRVWGFVPASHILGRAAWIWMSWDFVKKDFRWTRVGRINALEEDS